MGELKKRKICIKKCLFKYLIELILSVARYNDNSLN